MKLRTQNRRTKRRGAIVVLAAFLMVLLIAMVAFSLDYGYILTMKTDLQRAADAAALAAVQDLIPDAEGNQSYAAATASVTSYVRDNLGEAGFNVASTDIEIGRYDPATIYSGVNLLNNGIRDTVRVTLRRDGTTNSAVPLFFARALGIRDATVTATATAVLQKPSQLLPGADVLPFAVPLSEWDDFEQGDTWTIYGDGQIQDDEGDDIPGNWGTLDIGPSSNSTSDLADQMRNGLRQSDIDALYDDSRISSDSHIDSTDPIWLQADTGLSGGMQHAVEDIEGLTRVIPLYDSVNEGTGNNLQFRVVGWGIVTVTNSHFQGSQHSSVTIRKGYAYDGKLGAPGDLSAETNIEGAFTSPVLIQ